MAHNFFLRMALLYHLTKVQRSQRYMDLSLVESCHPELHEVLVQWSDRPELPQVEAPSYPAAT